MRRSLKNNKSTMNKDSKDSFSSRGNFDNTYSDLVMCQEMLESIKRTRKFLSLWIIASFLLVFFFKWWGFLALFVVAILLWRLFYARLDFELNSKTTLEWKKFTESLCKMSNTEKLWLVKSTSYNINTKINAGASYSASRVNAYVKLIKAKGKTGLRIKSNVETVLIKSKKCKILFMPSCILVKKGSEIIVCSYEQINLFASTTTFVESLIVAKDAEIVRMTWQYVNKDGTADRRYNYNNQLPVCLYGVLRIRGDSIDIELQTSNKNTVKTVDRSYQRYREYINKNGKVDDISVSETFERTTDLHKKTVNDFLGEFDSKQIASNEESKNLSNKLTKPLQKAEDRKPELKFKVSSEKIYNDNSYREIEYHKPTLECLTQVDNSMAQNYEQEVKQKAQKLNETLESFDVNAKLIDICRGPSVTRYELQPAPGVKISKITSLSDDIALAMAATNVRMEAPIPGKAAIGIEIPNTTRATVSLREILETTQYNTQVSKSKLSVAMGKNITGEAIICDIAKMPHLLIAGTTGSGKSVCLNSMIISLLFNASPDEVKLLMIDPKQVEFTVYNGIPHLLVPVVADPKKAAGALGWAVTEMLKRYKMFSDHNVRDIKGYNRLARMEGEMPELPQIVIFIDELSDLMMAAKKEVEDSICRLAQMARAAGMHLVIATQRLSSDVVTYKIKENFLSRVAFFCRLRKTQKRLLTSQELKRCLATAICFTLLSGFQSPCVFRAVLFQILRLKTSSISLKTSIQARLMMNLSMKRSTVRLPQSAKRRRRLYPSATATIPMRAAMKCSRKQ